MQLSPDSTQFLAELSSWSLNRVSRKTRFDTLMQKNGHRYHPNQLDAIHTAQREGSLYRFRVAHGPWFFGTTAEQAIRQAIKGEFTLQSTELVGSHG